MLTTAQAAERLGVSPRRVRAMIASGQLLADKPGRDWLVGELALEAVRKRATERPKKDVTA